MAWWDDETPADDAWWVKAARIAGGDKLAKTLADAYNASTAVARATVEQTKQDIAEELRRRAETAGTAVAKRMATEAEARVRKAAEKQAYAGGFQGMMTVGAIALLIWWLLARR